MYIAGCDIEDVMRKCVRLLKHMNMYKNSSLSAARKEGFKV